MTPSRQLLCKVFPFVLTIATVALSGCSVPQADQRSWPDSFPVSPEQSLPIKTNLPTVPWQADLGDGTYRNPVLYADYSDPDVTATDHGFYMTASSFNASPGLPLLFSTDLVNWQLVDYVVKQNQPQAVFAIPQHGNGIWAPCIRWHDGQLWIFYPDPDFGIYMTRTRNPADGWSEPRLILPGKGIIDPTPLWDDDGKAYLLHGWAKSRAGKNNILTLHTMSVDGTHVEPDGKVIIDGHQLPGYRTLEGPKFYKRNGYYYVFAPAGGVPVGWQSVFRATEISGPYEARIVMDQGDTLINGPHQGAWVHTPAGEDWFFHFQSLNAYGRIVHLQPMVWKNDWPVIGMDANGDGIGHPVSRYRKPVTDQFSSIHTLPAVDEFDAAQLSLAWQWNANYRHEWYSLEENPGWLRLFAQPDIDPDGHNLWLQPALLLQKLPAPEFIVETRLRLNETRQPVETGLVMFGEDYAWIGVSDDRNSRQLKVVTCRDARKGCTEHARIIDVQPDADVTLRMTVTAGGTTVFSYRDNTGQFRAVGELFQARPGRWVGAKVGLFARTSAHTPEGKQPFVDIDYFRFINPERLGY